MLGMLWTATTWRISWCPHQRSPQLYAPNDLYLWNKYKLILYYPECVLIATWRISWVWYAPDAYSRPSAWSWARCMEIFACPPDSNAPYMWTSFCSSFWYSVSEAANICPVFTDILWLKFPWDHNLSARHDPQIPTQYLGHEEVCSKRLWRCSPG